MKREMWRKSALPLAVSVTPTQVCFYSCKLSVALGSKNGLIKYCFIGSLTWSGSLLQLSKVCVTIAGLWHLVISEDGSAL